MNSITHDMLASGGADEPDGRKRKRDSLFLRAALTLDAETHDVRIRNLSEGGLMAELDRVVATGTAVTLELRGVGRITGKIAWCAEGRMGIVFDRKIDPQLARKPVGGGQKTPFYAKSAVVGR